MSEGNDYGRVHAGGGGFTKLCEALVEDELAHRSAAWTVHGDALQARGDPRGELVALERRLAASAPGRDAGALARRRAQIYDEQLEQLLGPTAWSVFARHQDAAWLDWRWCYGYFAELELVIREEVEDPGALIAGVLAAEAARFLPRLHLSLCPQALPAAVEALARRSRPLLRLSLDLRPRGPEPPTMVRASAAAALCEALPALRELELEGRGLFEDFSHPGLERLRLSGHDAILGLGLWTELPNSRELDFALMSGSLAELASDPGPRDEELADRLSGRGLPKLRRLDLSRNAPLHHAEQDMLRDLGGPRADALFAALAEAPVLAGLRELILAPPPSDAALVDRVLEAWALPRTARVELPVSFDRGIDELLARRVPRLEIAWQTYRRSRIYSKWIIEFSVSEKAWVWISYEALLEFAGERDSGLSADARLTLQRVLETWEELEEPGDDEGAWQADFPYAAVDRAMHELCAGVEQLPVGFIDQLLDILETHRGQASVVTIERLWGW